MALVAGVDSSTQSCKVVIRDLSSGAIVRTGSASHPEGTEVDPEAWLSALEAAIDRAGGLEDVSAISIAAQQHGLVALDSLGRVVRPALLWNDTRSASSADDLIAELGRSRFVEATGSVPVASFTISKLRWLRDNEPELASRVAAVALPHDWLTWRMRGFGPEGQSELGPDFAELATDRSDASGTGYFNSRTNAYDTELFEAALGRQAALPRLVAPGEQVGTDQAGRIYGPGAGDNAGAALGLNMTPGDVAISIGTSGTVFAITKRQAQDESGMIAGFADAAGSFLSIGVTLNAARVLKNGADLLGVDFDELSTLALSAQPGASGLVLVPYFEGERTPNLPQAKARLHGMSLESTTRQNLARAYVEGMLCGLAFGLDALCAQGVEVQRIFLIGGGSQNQAVKKVATTLFDYPIVIPRVSEYVAEGAAAQAAWVLTGIPPEWPIELADELVPDIAPKVRLQYEEATSSGQG